MVSYLTAAAVGNQWQNNFLISTLGLFIAAIYWTMLSIVANRHIGYEMLDPIKKDKAGSNTSAVKTAFKTAFLKSGAMVFVVVIFIKTAFDLGVKSLMPTIINESYESVSPKLATILSIIVLVAGIIGTYTAKFWYPHRFRTEASAIAAMFVVALIPCAIALFIGNISYWIIVGAMLLLVLLMSSVGLYTSSYFPTRFSKWGKGGTVAGITNFSASLGVVLANMVFTRIADAYGWVITVRVWFILLALGTLLALIAIPFWKRFLYKEGL
jgi:MFS family permease